jgi:hypothetical protein
MTLAVSETAPPTATRIPSVAILGADALLAALPASPVQLAHACSLAGFQSVVPASWGDELIAAATLRGLERHGHAPAVQCSCPFVAHRLLASGTDLRPFLVSLVSPPIALARYLRAAQAPAKLRITYVGRCPGAADEAIDARLTPEELLANLADRQIALEEQPRVFDSVIPPDRRRFRSQPGGLPAPEALWSDGGARSLVEVDGGDLPVELAQVLLSGKSVLVDVASRLGCVCSGATPDGEPRDARARVVALEPPRAQSPVVDERVPIDLELQLPASPRSAIDVVAPPFASSSGAPMPAPMADVAVPASESRDDTLDIPHITVPRITQFGSASTSSPSRPTARRPSPARGTARPVLGGMPTTQVGEGRQLPRAYVARRRLPPRVTRLESDARTKNAAEPVPSSPDTHVAMDGPVQASPGAATVASSPVPVSDFAHLASPAQLASTSSTTSAGSSLGDRASQGASAMSGLAEERSVAARVSDVVPENHRFRERSIELPVAPLSDTPARERPTTTLGPIAERSVRQLLVFAVLISTIVLVSAAIGILVGRWMAQR